MPLTDEDKAKIQREWNAEWKEARGENYKPDGDIETEWEGMWGSIDDFWYDVKNKRIPGVTLRDRAGENDDWKWKPGALKWLWEEMTHAMGGGRRRRTRKHKSRSKKTKRRHARK